MAELTLEQRVAALEVAVAELQRKLTGDTKHGNWWERFPPLTAEQREAHEEAAAYGRYFRRTGRLPPDDWKPGDAIPEPPEWSDEK
jgi:hypothetical protein